MNIEFWHDRKTVITGASSGIGAALAEHLVARGARIGLIGRNAERLACVRDAVTRAAGAPANTTEPLTLPSPRRAGERVCDTTVCETAIADVTDAAALRNAVQQLEAQLGPCDVLIAAAGIFANTNGRKFGPDVIRDGNQVVQTNLCGVINAFGAVLPGMVERNRGHLCAISSIAGMIGLPAAGAYSASKAGINRLCESLRIDLRKTGIKVTVVSPGFIDTPMMRDRPAALADRLKMMSAAQAAARIAQAIERGRAEYAFPTHTWLNAWIASKLPARWYVALWERLIRRKERLLQREQRG